jgi:hypothetical protein
MRTMVAATMAATMVATRAAAATGEAARMRRLAAACDQCDGVVLCGDDSDGGGCFGRLMPSQASCQDGCACVRARVRACDLMRPKSCCAAAHSWADKLVGVSMVSRWLVGVRWRGCSHTGCACVRVRVRCMLCHNRSLSRVSVGPNSSPQASVACGGAHAHARSQGAPLCCLRSSAASKVAA